MMSAAGMVTPHPARADNLQLTVAPRRELFRFAWSCAYFSRNERVFAAMYGAVS